MFSCFGSQKRKKRIVPASRTPDGNASTTRANGLQAAGMSNENTTVNLSVLAPPSSPASFINSALPSTAQSPNCFLSISANSPGGPSSTMFAPGPYAHETQLVSPPVFSTFTTEPSTAPLTPPPELAHLTTPSLISPASGTPRTGLSSPFPERDIPMQWDASASARYSPCSRNGSSKLFGLDSATTRNFILCPDSSFFYPATSAQFHLDQAQQSFPHAGGRLSISREADGYSIGGNRHNKTCKQDVEEIEAYRASFGFSADEIITTQNYVELPDPLDESFTMSPFANNKTGKEQCPITELDDKGKRLSNLLDPMGPKQDCKSNQNNIHAAPKHNCQSADYPPLLNVGTEKIDSRASDDQVRKRAHHPGQSFSDAEIDYRRARSLREANTLMAWRN
ncbi:hypothetical protein BHE74_00032696 [Ensete ventricosum]|nr:hypothetical protein GW17_00023724 [Ensete ventricosum]RWW60317.1 hypothetical protein BHE74_00032696 [Ensete ventricosum]